MPSYYNNNNNNNNTRDAEDRVWGMTCPQCFTSADVAVVKNVAWICVCVLVGCIPLIGLHSQQKDAYIRIIHEM